MIRVLHVLGSMNRGGIETSLMNIYRNIGREKIQFDFLLSTGKQCAYNDEIRRLGGQIYSVPSRRDGITRQKKGLEAFFKEHPEYQVVHCHVSSLTDITALKAAYKHGVSVRIIHSRSTLVRGRSRLGQLIHTCLHYLNRRNIDRYATHIFAVSELAGRWLAGGKRYDRGKCAVMYNGIDTDKFRYNPEARGRLRREWKLDNSFVIGHVGRFNPVKNHLFLIDVLYEVTQTRTDAKLFLVGDGSLRAGIEAKAARLGIADKVILAGVRDDVHDLLNVFDVFALPSLYEGLPGAAIEAQAAGLPCFLSDRITREADITGLVTYLPINGTQKLWAEAIAAMPAREDSNDTKDYSRIAAGSDFNIKTQAGKWEEFYGQIR